MDGLGILRIPRMQSRPPRWQYSKSERYGFEEPLCRSESTRRQFVERSLAESPGAIAAAGAPRGFAQTDKPVTVGLVGRVYAALN